MDKREISHTIPRRHQRCYSCRTAFAAGALYRTQLFFEAECVRRCDLCSDCSLLEGQAVFWVGRVALLEQREGWSERALSLLQSLCLEGSRGEAFLVALFLARAKLLLLRHEESLPEGGKQLWYECVLSGELIAVPKAHLHELPSPEEREKLAERLR